MPRFAPQRVGDRADKTKLMHKQFGLVARQFAQGRFTGTRDAAQYHPPERFGSARAWDEIAESRHERIGTGLNSQGTNPWERMRRGVTGR